MKYIDRKDEFYEYMKKKGPNKEGSRNNYISWLEFIAKQGFEINQNLRSNEEIISFLKENEKERRVYKSRDAYSDFGSALNKYRSFIYSRGKDIFDDFKDIEKEKINETEKTELRKARIGQGKFRNQLIELWGKCSVTGFEKTEILVASHILPWRKSTNKERLDKFNGLLLTPNYDKLFDKALISFDDEGKILISQSLKDEDLKLLGVSKDASIRKDKLTDKHLHYLSKHREIFYENKENIEIQ